MNSEEVAALVRRLIDEYHYELPEPGTTLGTPWSQAKIVEHVILLKSCLVQPYKQMFLLREGGNPPKPNAAEIEGYWVVAERPGFYLEWFDPSTGEFGLGKSASNGQPAASIGVRGDVVGVFCAM